MDRVQLADFLKSRRARVAPADAGIDGGSRRRTPGLRREEVARLAGISVDYYARLEQARGPRPSRQVLGALGRALRLHDDERTYLFQLAGEQPGPAAGPSPHVSAGIRHLLDRLDDTPAFVIDAKYELLAWNPMAVALMGDPAVLMPESRNMIWNLFAGPAGLDASLSEFADECVADLRAASVRYPADEGIQSLVARLRAASPEFVRRWDEHRVSVRRATTKRVTHPVHGELVFDCEVLDIADAGQKVIFYTAAAGSHSAWVLCSLRRQPSYAV
ncbi:helix-turn-helix domain-containing protein [Dactylosporangium aurantiacum]|uniref:Helix-turn-helix domain-containing protein n=1 Tax=Dactylosporangium aurantiacum TaxID=35754 RepID=A0A9Q9II67_9ACTN|nr:helix-turn-helix transcriptional regulator [Dactylosporangium aurantiacum]MDG6104485.1 helix-turn-helix transcriptional regulator [Dactylosporangium aurantiacum]UWZ56101.1 helix-turn-helix domain-containing protein [Dactylosporangium aurantiacum]